MTDYVCFDNYYHKCLILTLEGIAHWNSECCFDQVWHIHSWSVQPGLPATSSGEAFSVAPVEGF